MALCFDWDELEVAEVTKGGVRAKAADGTRGVACTKDRLCDSAGDDGTGTNHSAFDSRLELLERSVEAIQSAGRLVLRLSALAPQEEAGADGSGGQREQKVWTTATDDLYSKAVREVEQSLASMHVPRSRDAWSQRSTLEGTPELFLAEMNKKWCKLKLDKDVWLKRRAALKRALQSTRYAPEMKDSTEVVVQLQAAYKAERSAGEFVESMVNDLAAHLVQTQRGLLAQCALFAHHRDNAIRTSHAQTQRKLQAQCSRALEAAPKRSGVETAAASDAAPPRAPDAEVTGAQTRREVQAAQSPWGGSPAAAANVVAVGFSGDQAAPAAAPFPSPPPPPPLP
eukprot:CAMPEP_0115466584 /NCGR_PEP_ID=MMETSP0271-20121206/49995_1 /TAXON_ID=71861 /ORGANISM="Scrippsiella trochoidea, Strain CCMP3099" /LENGTH=339 /DNA_ID=CAMNT_0002893567 /DNA_START=57 /DNA_END=1072 /DNA_ORIENTATION=+